MPGGVAELKEMIQSEHCGDAKYLDGVRACIAQRSKMLGLDAPDKLDLSANVTVKGYVSISPDDWDDGK